MQKLTRAFEFPATISTLFATSPLSSDVLWPGSKPPSARPAPRSTSTPTRSCPPSTLAPPSRHTNGKFKLLADPSSRAPSCTAQTATPRPSYPPSQKGQLASFQHAVKSSPTHLHPLPTRDGRRHSPPRMPKSTSFNDPTVDPSSLEERGSRRVHRSSLACRMIQSSMRRWRGISRDTSRVSSRSGLRANGKVRWSALGRG